MSADRPAYQVVFLIDLARQSQSHTDLEQQNSEDDRKTAVSLCIFRVLSHLLSKIQEKCDGNDRNLIKACSRLKWGCKFFDSHYHTTGRVERSPFKSFKLKHFEAFEKETERRLRKKSESKDGDGKKRQQKDPAENLAMVLSEVFSDFQWERPDLMSPGRPHRRKGRPARWGKAGLNSSREESEGLSSTTRNLLFVLSNCPHNEDRLKTFCGKKCIDGDVFLDSVLQGGMLEKLRGNLNLDVFWVDTNSLSKGNDSEIDVRSVSKVNEALSKVGGQIIPLDAIVRGDTDYMLSMYDLRVSSLGNFLHNVGEDLEKPQQENCSAATQANFDSSLIIPVSSSLDFFLQTQPKVDVKRRSIEKIPVLEEKETAGTVFIKNGNERKALCRLNLQHATTVTKNITSSPGDVQSTVPTDTQPETDSKWRDLHSHPVNAETLMKGCSFHIQGVVPSQVELITTASNSQTFVCCGQHLEEHGDNPGKKSAALFPLKSKTFEKLMTELSRQQKVLILSVNPVDVSSSMLSPCLAMLHPFTCTSGLLVLVSVNKTLHIEKQLLLSDSKARETTVEDTVTATSGFSHWRENFVRDKLKHSSASSVSYEPKVSAECSQSMAPFSSRVLERWFPSGQSDTMANLVFKLSERVDTLGFLDKDEKHLLKQVQKLYRKENQPLLQQTSTTQKKTPEVPVVKTDATEADNHDEVDGEVCEVVLMQRLLTTNTNIVKGCRGERMLTKVIQKSKVKVIVPEKDGTEEATCKKERSRPDIGAVDYQDEGELLTYLTEAYNKVVYEEGETNTCVQTVVLVALHFLKTTGADNPEICMKHLLEEKFLLTNAMLRRKHNEPDCGFTEGQKLLEYKLQIQLQYEVAAAQTELDTMTEDTVEEICNMLRKLSISGQLDIKKYLEDVLVQHYMHTMPKSLAAVYHSLTLPLPHDLAKLVPTSNRSGDQSSLDDSCLDGSLFSPGSEAASSIVAQSNPPSLGQPLSSTSDILTSVIFKSQKSRKLVVHPSLSDIGPKRQILVQKIPANKQKTSKSKRARTPGSARKRTASARKKLGSARKSRLEGSTKKVRTKKDPAPSDDMKAVRRNLFTMDSKLERRQSVAVMENLISPRRSSSHRNQHKSPRKSPRVKSNTPNLVVETPAHKQLSKRLVQKSRGRKQAEHIHSAPIVEESPVKQPSSAESSATKEESIVAIVKRLSKSPANVALPRRTFYSAGPRNRSRNMEKYRQLADRIAGRTPSSREKLKSPARQFVVKQLKGSPSPSHGLRRTLRKPDLTPVKGRATTLVADSPSQNTRAKTPSRLSVKSALYQDQPVRPTSGRTPRKETVTRKLTLSLTTPEKTRSQCKIPIIPNTPTGLTTLRQTTSKTNASSEEPFSDCTTNNLLTTPKRDTAIRDIVMGDCVSGLNSPCQNTRSRSKPSPGAVLSRHLSFDIRPSSDIEPSMGIRNLSFDLDSMGDKSSVWKPCRSVGKKAQSTPVTPVKESPNTSIASCERTPQKLIETTPRKSCLKTPNRQQQQSSTKKSPNVHGRTPPTPASILKKTGFSPGLGSPRPTLKVRWKEDEVSKVSNLSKRMAEVENHVPDSTKRQDNPVLNIQEDCVVEPSLNGQPQQSSQNYPTVNSAVEENPDKLFVKLPRTKVTMPSPSPVKKVRVRTPDSLDSWPRRKPRLGCDRGSSSSPKTPPHQSSVSPGSDTSGPRFISENTTPDQELPGKRRRRWRMPSSKIKTRCKIEKDNKLCSLDGESKECVSGSKRVLITRPSLNVLPEDNHVKPSDIQDGAPRSGCPLLKPVSLSFNAKSSASSCGLSDLELNYTDNVQRKRSLSAAFSDQQIVSLSKRPHALQLEPPVSKLHQRVLQQDHDNRIASSTSNLSSDFSSINTSSLGGDYFSSANEDVFLSDKSPPSSVFEDPLDSWKEPQTDPVVSPSKCPLGSPQSVTSTSSPVFHRLESLRKFKGKTLSSGSESGFELPDTGSNSPVFLPKQSTPCVRKKSIGLNRKKSNTLLKKSMAAKAVSEKSDQEGISESPNKEFSKNQISPSGMKSFSPNVSAKGLLALMNSPLLRSGPGKRERRNELMEGDNLDNSFVSFTASHNDDQPSRSRKRRKVVARSRRSLNLFK